MYPTTLIPTGVGHSLSTRQVVGLQLSTRGSRKFTQSGSKGIHIDARQLFEQGSVALAGPFCNRVTGRARPRPLT
jgi:hypothetical protein